MSLSCVDGEVGEVVWGSRGLAAPSTLAIVTGEDLTPHPPRSPPQAPSRWTPPEQEDAGCRAGYLTRQDTTIVAGSCGTLRACALVQWASRNSTHNAAKLLQLVRMCHKARFCEADMRVAVKTRPACKPSYDSRREARLITPWMHYITSHIATVHVSALCRQQHVFCHC